MQHRPPLQVPAPLQHCADVLQACLELAQPGPVSVGFVSSAGGNVSSTASFSTAVSSDVSSGSTTFVSSPPTGPLGALELQANAAAQTTKAIAHEAEG